MNMKSLVFLSTLALSIVAHADDTEIYLGNDTLASGILPNVVFILDTSGSMDDSVEVVNGFYDPTETYTGSCNSDRYYFSTASASVPSCSDDNDIETSAFKCDNALTALGNTGYATDRFASYRTSHGTWLWRTLSSSSQSRTTECMADYGIHGDGGTGLYPAHSWDGGPYISSTTDAVAWNSIGGAYTIYSPNYLNWYNGAGTVTTSTRIAVVKDVVSDIVQSTNGINAAVMRFDQGNNDNNEGGYFLTPMQAINSTTRPGILTAIDGLAAWGWTPLAETMYEAARFYRGEAVEFGNSTTPGTNHANVLDNSTTYDSPISYQCQKNFIVLLTDGEPTIDDDADTDIAALPGFTTAVGTCSHSSDNCLDELAHYLATVDQNSTMPTDQKVFTYTIGFHTDQDLLQDTATKGLGRYFTANNVAGLTAAFTAIITEILAVDTTFLAPAIPVNAFNRLTHDDSLYFALFRPEETPYWNGNLKRYKLTSSGDLVDKNDTVALDASTGFFVGDTQSFWTHTDDAPDGAESKLGGFASRLTVTRNLYTNTDSAETNVQLTDNANAFHESNTALTHTLLNIVGNDEAYRTQLVQWARGVDVADEDEDGASDDARRLVGDPLHSLPVTINYRRIDANTADLTIYLTTNEGFLHAINASTGAEVFGFIPNELLPNLDQFYQNQRNVDHLYGLDGLITPWIKDVNGNGVVANAAGTTESGEHVYLYYGMRRGGRNIYAMDVTNRAAPRLKWTIRGGSGDFAQLGQTWGPITYGKIKLNGTERDVLFIAGGYDPAEDSMDIPVTVSQGNAVYIVDATTGARIWWAGPSSSQANLELAGLNHSIPGGLSVIDIDGDGLADTLFAADTGGQVWRFDVSTQATSASGLVTGGKIAALSDGTIAGSRRFYYRPDVSVIYRPSGYHFALGLGSGHRAHPLDIRAQNRFYMLFDPDVNAAPTTYSLLSTLLDATSDAQLSTLDASNGWYINMRAGEKILAESRTITGLTLFTSYTPGPSNVTSCAPSIGIGRTYAVETANARPALDWGTTDLTNMSLLDQRTHQMARGGIPPEPTVVFPPNGDPKVVVGTETLDNVTIENPIRRLNWRAE